MKIFTNGFPKSGNHALVKACQLLGQPCEVNHATFAEGIPVDTTHSIFIKRDPRNIIISWLRFTGKPVTQGEFILILRDFNGKPFITAMAEYEGWLTDPNTMVVKFEDLVANDTMHKSIAAYLGVQYLEDAFPNLAGGTMTWTGKLSDYTQFWTPIIEDVWQSLGGAELLSRWGY